jgi:integrase/recombinase XerD
LAGSKLEREDVLGYLEGIKKPESADPTQKWIGTYNLYLVLITRFFKWFYHPDIPCSERPKPAIVANLKKAKYRGGKKRKAYKPTDMWTLEDNLVFLKYCPDPKMVCYHALAIDTGARPHEILSLKIEDIIWPPDGGYPRFVVHGKTGMRSLISCRFHKYIRKWQERHPKRSIPSSILIYSEKIGGFLNGRSLRAMYTDKLKSYFTKLLDEPIGQDDRNQILHLLQKPWNPYVLRHTTATEYSGRLTTPDANQWFGWSENSNTPSFYRHYYGDEAGKRLLESLGLAPQNHTSPLPKLRECPNVNCRELNTPEAPFCVKCNVPLTVAGHIEQGHQKEREIAALREQTQIMSKQLADVIEQQQQHANTFDMKFVKLLDIVKIAIIRLYNRTGTRSRNHYSLRIIQMYYEKCLRDKYEETFDAPLC